MGLQSLSICGLLLCLSRLLFGVAEAAVVRPRQDSSRVVPDYVLDYAPVVYLFSDDPYYPSDIAAFPKNTLPLIDFDEIPNDASPPVPSPLTLDNLDELNAYGDDGENVYLTSIEDPTTDPEWLYGIRPDEDGVTQNGTTAVVVTVDKGDGVLDAFYFYFYAYNWGGRLLDVLNLGNHVGDWEHNMVRFENGEPTYVWYSQHESGQAFRYSVLLKEGLRPIAYSANGTHANYAITGDHDHLIPNLNLPQGIYEDKTDDGLRWDPIQAAHFYSYKPDDNDDSDNSDDDESGTFTPYPNTINGQGGEGELPPTAYLYFDGRWGDKSYPDDDPRQFSLFGVKRVGNGPRGPADKQLNRERMCLDTGNPCILLWWLAP